MRRFLSTALAIVMLAVSCITFVPVVSAAQSNSFVLTPDNFAYTTSNNRRINSFFRDASWVTSNLEKATASDGTPVIKQTLTTVTTNGTATPTGVNSVIRYDLDSTARANSDTTNVLDMASVRNGKWSIKFVVKYRMNEAAAAHATTHPMQLSLGFVSAGTWGDGSEVSWTNVENSKADTKSANEWLYSVFEVNYTSNSINASVKTDLYKIQLYPYANSSDAVPTGAVTEIAYMGLFEDEAHGISYPAEPEVISDPVAGGVAPSVLEGAYFDRTNATSAIHSFTHPSWGSANIAPAYLQNGQKVLRFTSKKSGQGGEFRTYFYYASDADAPTTPLLNLSSTGAKVFAAKIKYNAEAVAFLNTVYQTYGHYVSVKYVNSSGTVSSKEFKTVSSSFEAVADEWVYAIVQLPDEVAALNKVSMVNFSPFGNSYGVYLPTDKNIVVDVAWMGFFASETLAREYDNASKTPVPGTADTLITYEDLYKGVVDDQAPAQPYGIVKSWHSYTIKKTSESVVIGAPPAGNTNKNCEI